jgi:anti-sigma B factor antagonist
LGLREPSRHSSYVTGVRVEISRESNPRAEITVDGELDVASVWQLEAAITEAASRHTDIDLDLSRVSFFDAAAVGALVNGRTTAQAQGNELRVRNVAPIVRRVLEIVELTDWIEEGDVPGESG